MALMPFLGLAQNLTMAELVGFLKKDIADIEEIMTTKGWEMTKLDTKNPNMPTATFAYKRVTNHWNDNNVGKAASFLSATFSLILPIYKMVELQVHNREKYNQYMNTIKTYKCRLIKTEVEEGCIRKTYQGSTTTFVVSACPAESHTSIPHWHFYIYPNALYNRLYVDED